MPTKLIKSQFKQSDYANHSEYRKALKNHLRSALHGKCVYNKSAGIKIEFNNVGIDKMLSSFGEIKVNCCCNLQLILGNGVLSEVVADRNERPDISNFLLIKTKVDLDDVEYEVWSYIREKDNGYFLYSINIKV